MTRDEFIQANATKHARAGVPWTLALFKAEQEWQERTRLVRGASLKRAQEAKYPQYTRTEWMEPSK